MGSVDIADQLRSYFFTQCVAHWNWQPFFYWLLDTAIINSYRLARINGSPTTHCGFRSSPTTSLLTAGHKSSSSKPKLTFLYRSWPIQVSPPQSTTTILYYKELITTKAGRRRWNLKRPCSNTENYLSVVLMVSWRRQQGGLEVKIHQVRSQCEWCHVALCHSCFPLYHGIGRSSV